MVGFIQYDESDVPHCVVVAGVRASQSGVKCLDGCHNHVCPVDSYRCVPAGVEPRNPKVSPFRSDAPPNLLPRVDRLLTQLFAVRYPEYVATEVIVPHCFDNGLDSHASLAGPCRKADQSATRHRPGPPCSKHEPQFVNDQLLVLMQIG